MATKTFKWYPNEGASEDMRPDVASTKFGDGYEQRVAKGINSKVISWTLRFTGSVSDMLPIRAFLSDRNGQESFMWKNPFKERSPYICRQWTASKVSAEMVEISAKFERVYESVVDEALLEEIAGESAEKAALAALAPGQKMPIEEVPDEFIA